MKILGIDPATKRTGWGVIEAKEGDLVHLEHGVIVALPTMEEIGQKLFYISSRIIEICKKHQPDIVCIEETFCGRNGMTSLRLGYVFGVILSTLASMRIPVFKYPTKLVKRIIAKKGSSDKDQVELAVVRLLKLKSIDNQDSSDALAVAMAHVLQTQAPAKKTPVRKKIVVKRVGKRLLEKVGLK